jgi:uncharacterized protein (DUF302 family)
MSSNELATVTGVVSQSSPYSVDETLQQIEQVLRERGLTIFARFDHSGEARKVGLSMQPAHVLVFGNPKAGTPLMVASPLIALDLPLKILVWQDPQKQVWVSYAEPSSLAQRYSIPADLAKVLAAAQGIVEAALQGAATRPTGTRNG